MDPKALVAPVAADILRHASEVEATRKLPDELVAALGRAGLLGIYAPRQFGGLELPLPDALRVVEEVSRLDGSTGWTVALGAGLELFTCSLQDEQAARVIGNCTTIMTGATGLAVRATPVDGGYRLSGRWGFNSGAPNATWMTVTAPVVDGDSPRMGPDGPEMIMAFLPSAEVEVIDTWHVSGLRGTGTQDLRVDDVFVPASFTGGFALPMGPRAARPSVLARIPFLTMLAIAQAPPVCLGIARRAIDEFRELARQKERPPSPRLSDQPRAQAGLAHAEALLESARSYWYANVAGLWEAALEGREISLATRASVRMASLMAAENAVAAVDLVFRLSGSTAIFEACPIERCWRDVHAAAQHVQVQDGRWEDSGRVLFGLEPATPFV